MNTIIKANAKINLFLDITGKRADGYHELDSIMLSVGIADILHFEKTENAGIEIVCESEGFPLDNKNIIWKAGQALFEKYGLSGKAGIKVTVEKNIPSQAGMGGGSADGAAALVAVNELFGLGLCEDKLIETGALIGADVPFCIKGGCCICRGIGEKLEELKAETPLPIVVIKPDTAVSTPAAYKAYDGLKDPEHRDISSIISAIKYGNREDISRELFNAFELTVKDEKIDKAKHLILENGALGALMTGSGSAVFGIFNDEKSAEAAYNTIRQETDNTYLCSSRSSGLEIINKE